MATDLPSEFDVIVLGTGMPESIAAAAFSRIGQAVLHLDRNEFYSGDWASFNLQGIENWAKQHQDPDSSTSGLQRPSVDENSLLDQDETLVQLPLNNSNFTNIHLTFHVEEGEEEILEEDKAVKNVTPPVNISKTVENEEDQKKEPTDSESNADATTKETYDETSAKTIDIESNITEALEDFSLKDSEQEDAGIQDESVVSQSEERTDLGKNDEGGNNIDNIDEKGDKAYCDIDKQVEANNQKETSGDDVETGKVSDVDEKEKRKVENDKKEWTIKRLKAEWRKFNLDLSPKVLYSGGAMVELLITSDIAKYCEFKTVTRLLTLLNGEVEKVPCSRADVFSSKKVTMIEKRMLMKFLQFCVKYENKPDEIQDFLQKPFSEFLTHKKLTANVKHYIQHSIAMATDSTTTEQGLLQMKNFLKSVGRYGNTAFLWSLYGSGELPQSFCRMCAVFGGIYCLRMSAASLILNKENRCVGIITTEGQRISCKWLIMNNNYAPDQYVDRASSGILSRAIIMTDKPLLPTDQQELSLMCLPCPDDGDRPIHILELPPSSLACTKLTYIFHLTRRGLPDSKPEDNLKHAVEKLFTNGTDANSEKPRILWSAYFTQTDMSRVQPTDKLPTNIILMSGPGSDIDIDQPVSEAREVFHKILPEEEFLPKAPNPEDIIYVDDSEAQVVEEGNQSEFKDSDNSQSESKSEAGSQSESKAEDVSQSEFKDTDVSKSESKGAKSVETRVAVTDSSQPETQETFIKQSDPKDTDNNQSEMRDTGSSQEEKKATKEKDSES